MPLLLESSPNAISVFEAIRDDAGTIADFRVVLANDQIVRISGYEEP